MTGHIFSPTPVFIAKDYYEALPEEYQTAIQEAATEAAPYQREQIDEQEATGVETLKENGMEVNDVDKTPFKEATAPIYDEYVKEGTGCVSPEIYQQVQEIIALIYCVRAYGICADDRTCCLCGSLFPLS